MSSNKDRALEYLHINNVGDPTGDQMMLYQDCSMKLSTDDQEWLKTIQAWEVLMKCYVEIEEDLNNDQNDLGWEALELFRCMEQCGVEFSKEKYCKIFKISPKKWLDDENVLSNILMWSKKRLVQEMQKEIVDVYLNRS